MTAAKQGIQLSVEKGVSTATIGGTKVEVSPDSNVTVYTNDGVQTKPASEAAAKGTHISEDFNTVVLNGATIEQSADGHLVISTPGIVITKPAPANDAAVNAEPQIGDVMLAGHKHAGWVYAGISKTTHEPFYVAPKDSGVFQWKQAMDFAAKDGSRLPSKEELDQLYEAKDKGALKGTFNVTGSNTAGWYWSSRVDDGFFAWAQRFSDGRQDYLLKSGDSSLRCVR